MVHQVEDTAQDVSSKINSCLRVLYGYGIHTEITESILFFFLSRKKEKISSLS